MTPEDLIPSKDERRVIAFCESLSPNSKPFYVSVAPESGFQSLQCSINVGKKIESKKGEAVQGWEISQVPKIYLEARFHTVWKSPSGDYVDVTPEDAGQSEVLFLPDARYKDSEPQVLKHRLSLAKDAALVERYWSVLDEVESLMQSAAWGAIRTSDPAMQRHISGLQKEATAIRERLQNAEQGAPRTSRARRSLDVRRT